MELGLHADALAVPRDLLLIEAEHALHRLHLGIPPVEAAPVVVAPGAQRAGILAVDTLPLVDPRFVLAQLFDVALYAFFRCRKHDPLLSRDTSTPSR